MVTLSLFHTPFTPKVTSGASTKLCICQCKQMSFQLPFESTCISKFLESRRKIIPCFRSGIREASLAELALHYWKFISESVRRSESSSDGQISGRRYNVRQVGRSTANMHQMHKYAQFLNVMRNLTGSQCRLRSAGVMCSRVPVPVMSLAAAFWTRCSGSIDDWRSAARMELQVI